MIKARKAFYTVSALVLLSGLATGATAQQIAKDPATEAAQAPIAKTAEPPKADSQPQQRAGHKEEAAEVEAQAAPDSDVGARNSKSNAATAATTAPAAQTEATPPPATNSGQSAPTTNAQSDAVKATQAKVEMIKKLLRVIKEQRTAEQKADQQQNQKQKNAAGVGTSTGTSQAAASPDTDTDTNTNTSKSSGDSTGKAQAATTAPPHNSETADSTTAQSPATPQDDPSEPPQTSTETAATSRDDNQPAKTTDAKEPDNNSVKAATAEEKRPSPTEEALPAVAQPAETAKAVTPNKSPQPRQATPRAEPTETTTVTTKKPNTNPVEQQSPATRARPRPATVADAEPIAPTDKTPGAPAKAPTETQMAIPKTDPAKAEAKADRSQGRTQDVEQPAQKTLAQEKPQQQAPQEKSTAKRAEQPKTLTVASWGGGYGSAQRQTVIDPFATFANIDVTQIRHDGEGRELDNEADVIDIGSARLAQACAAGKLLPLNDLQLAPAPNGISVDNDFIEGGRTRCGIGSLAWSHIVLVRGQAFRRRQPTDLAQVFNAHRYPGKRAFVKDPRFLLEMALMADGVAPAQVYSTLDQPFGVERALTKLASLRKHIIWVDKVTDAYKLLQRGKVAIAAGFSGRAFRMSRLDPGLRIIWDGQIYDVQYWAIPKTSKNIPAARRFLVYATSPEQLAANARRFPYGPMRKSAVELAKRHDILNINLQPYLPTSATNLRRALRFNASWWATNGPLIKPRMDVWFAEMAVKAKARKRRDKRASRAGQSRKTAARRNTAGNTTRQ